MQLDIEDEAVILKNAKSRLAYLLMVEISLMIRDYRLNIDGLYQCQ